VTRPVTQGLGLNVVCPYYTMFPLAFPAELLRRAAPGDWVLDPFCGRGTTLFAAREAGLPCVGVDSSPVAVAIAEAKLCSATSAQVAAECERILTSGKGLRELPQGEFWTLAYHPDTLRELCTLREDLLEDCSTDVRKLLRALILGRLHGPLRRGLPSYLSNQMPRTFAPKPAYSVRFWRARGLLPPRVDVLDLVRRTAGRYFDRLPAAVSGQVRLGDARRTDFASLGGPYAWVITSPPYYGMRTYVPDQWLRNWFLGGPADVAYEFEGQLSHRSPEQFVEDLATVWRSVAAASRSGARLVVRFGGIRDRKASPRDLLVASLRASGSWQLETVVPTAPASRAGRQASQFRLPGLAEPVEEADYHAQLTGPGPFGGSGGAFA